MRPGQRIPRPLSSRNQDFRCGWKSIVHPAPAGPHTSDEKPDMNDSPETQESSMSITTTSTEPPCPDRCGDLRRYRLDLRRHMQRRRHRRGVQGGREVGGSRYIDVARRGGSLQSHPLHRRRRVFAPFNGGDLSSKSQGKTACSGRSRVRWRRSIDPPCPLFTRRSTSCIGPQKFSPPIGVRRAVRKRARNVRSLRARFLLAMLQLRYSEIHIAPQQHKNRVAAS